MAVSKQASKHTHARVQCSHISVGLAQARPNKMEQAFPLIFAYCHTTSNQKLDGVKAWE